MEDDYTLSTRAGSRFPAPGSRMANVAQNERLASLAAGAALLGYAWKRRSAALGLLSGGLLVRGATGFCPAYAAIGVARTTDTRDALAGSRGIHIREAITIDAPADELYRYWRQLERLPEVMPHLALVQQLDGKRSKWTAKAFDQVPVTWEAEIINDVPGETIAWKTLPGESIQSAGSVTFKPARRPDATEVRVHLQYAPPGGKTASWFAWLVDEDPAKLTRDGLRALKRRFELPSTAAPATHEAYSSTGMFTRPDVT